MKFMYLPLLALVLAAPHIVFAQQLDVDNNPLVQFMQGLIVLIDYTVVPFIFALALVAFLWGIFKYFIAGGADEEARNNGKNFMIWGMIGFFVMVSIWGIVNLLTSTFNFGADPRPDLPTFRQGSGGTQQNNNSAFPPARSGATDNNSSANSGSCVSSSQCPSGQVCIDNICQ